MSSIMYIPIEKESKKSLKNTKFYRKLLTSKENEGDESNEDKENNEENEENNEENNKDIHKTFNSLLSLGSSSKYSKNLKKHKFQSQSNLNYNNYFNSNDSSSKTLAFINGTSHVIQTLKLNSYKSLPKKPETRMNLVQQSNKFLFSDISKLKKEGKSIGVNRKQSESEEMIRNQRLSVERRRIKNELKGLYQRKLGKVARFLNLGLKIEKDIYLEDVKKVLKKKNRNMVELEFLSDYIRKNKHMKSLISPNDDVDGNKKFKDELILKISKSLYYDKAYNDQIVFKYGDVPDKFYIIIKGKASVLVPKEKEVFMRRSDLFYYYCLLSYYEEYGLLRKAFELNKYAFENFPYPLEVFIPKKRRKKGSLKSKVKSLLRSNVKVEMVVSGEGCGLRSRSSMKGRVNSKIQYEIEKEKESLTKESKENNISLAVSQVNLLSPIYKTTKKTEKTEEIKDIDMNIDINLSNITHKVTNLLSIHKNPNPNPNPSSSTTNLKREISFFMPNEINFITNPSLKLIDEKPLNSKRSSQFGNSSERKDEVNTINLNINKEDKVERQRQRQVLIKNEFIGKKNYGNIVNIRRNTSHKALTNALYKSVLNYNSRSNSLLYGNEEKVRKVSTNSLNKINQVMKSNLNKRHTDKNLIRINQMLNSNSNSNLNSKSHSPNTSFIYKTTSNHENERKESLVNIEEEKEDSIFLEEKTGKTEKKGRKPSEKNKYIKFLKLYLVHILNRIIFKITVEDYCNRLRFDYQLSSIKECFPFLEEYYTSEIRPRIEKLRKRRKERKVELEIFRSKQKENKEKKEKTINDDIPFIENDDEYTFININDNKSNEISQILKKNEDKTKIRHSFLDMFTITGEKKVKVKIFEYFEVSTLSSSEKFGDVALSNDLKRSATIITKDDSDFAILTKDSYSQSLKDISDNMIKKNISILLSSKLFHSVSLSFIKKHGIINLFHISSMNRSKIVYFQGEEIKKKHFIKKGSFQFSFIKSLFDIDCLLYKLNHKPSALPSFFTESPIFMHEYYRLKLKKKLFILEEAEFIGLEDMSIKEKVYIKSSVQLRKELNCQNWDCLFIEINENDKENRDYTCLSSVSIENYIKDYMKKSGYTYNLSHFPSKNQNFLEDVVNLIVKKDLYDNEYLNNKVYYYINVSVCEAETVSSSAEVFSIENEKFESLLRLSPVFNLNLSLFLNDKRRIFVEAIEHVRKSMIKHIETYKKADFHWNLLKNPRKIQENPDFNETLYEKKGFNMTNSMIGMSFKSTYTNFKDCSLLGNSHKQNKSNGFSNSNSVKISLYKSNRNNDSIYKNVNTTANDSVSIGQMKNKILSSLKFLSTTKKTVQAKETKENQLKNENFLKPFFQFSKAEIKRRMKLVSKHEISWNILSKNNKNMSQSKKEKDLQLNNSEEIENDDIKYMNGLSKDDFYKKCNEKVRLLEGKGLKYLNEKDMEMIRFLKKFHVNVKFFK